MTKKKSTSAISRFPISVSGSAAAVIAADDGGVTGGGGGGTNIKMKKTIRKNNRKEKPPPPPPTDCCALRPPYDLTVRPPSRKFPASINNDGNENVDDDDCGDEDIINTVDDVFENVCNLLKKKRNIMVLVGAGISTSLGIPDFRSKDIGLYNTLKKTNEYIGLDCPEDLFCIEFFKDNPRPFYKFAKQLYYPKLNKKKKKNDIVQKEDDGVSTNTKKKKTKIETRTNAAATNNNTRNRKLKKKEEEKEERTTNKICSKTQTQIETKTKTTVVSDSHKLLALLEKKKMLLRVYTQNIDGYESVAGVSDSKIVYCHGSLKQVSCLSCNKGFSTTTPPTASTDSKDSTDSNSGEDYKNDDNSRKRFMSSIQSGSVPYCKEPSKQNYQMEKKKKINGISTTSNVSSSPFPSPSRTSSRNRRKRCRSVLGIDNDNNDEYQEHQEQHDDYNYCNGILKPSITFFGEKLSNHVNKRIEYDRQKVDALIVIGTSLSVAPISKVIDYLPFHIPRILINKTPITKVPKQKQKQNYDDDSNGNDDDDVDFRKDYVFDSYLLGYCDDIARVLGKQLGLGFDTTGNNNKDNSNKSNSNNNSNGKKKNRAAKTPTPRPSMNSNNKSNRYAASDASARLLTTVLRDAKQKKSGEGENDDDDNDNDNDNDEGRSNIDIGKIPPERIILFPGADITSASSSSLSATTTNNSKEDRTNNRDDDDHGKDQEQEQEETTTTTHEEIANCDGCSQIINTDGVVNGNNNGTIYKCSVCFDYDLCSTCYPKQSKIHYNGQHKFYIE